MCIFCDKIKQLGENQQTSYWAVIEDAYPVNKGHLLIVPKRHITNTDDITANEWYDLQQTIGAVKRLISDEEKQKEVFGKIITEEDTYPDGFNIGINEGKAAGQTIPHLHIHVIPRYFGDIEDPTGGVRGVIPNKQKYK